MEKVRRRWWTRILSVVALLIVAAAVLGGLFRLAVDMVPTWRATLENRVSDVIGVPLHIGAVELTWRDLQPGLVLHDVDVTSSSGKTNVHLASAHIVASLAQLLLGKLRVSSIQLAGLAVTLRVDAKGQVSEPVVPLNHLTHDQAWISALSSVRSVRVSNCTISIEGAAAGHKPQYFLVDLSGWREGGGVQVQIFARPPPGLARDVRLHLTLRGNPLQVRSWVGDWRGVVDGLRACPWLDHLFPPTTRLVFDNGHVNAAGRIDKGRIVSLRAEADAVALAAAQKGNIQARIRHMNMRARANRVSDGWELSYLQLKGIGSSGPWSTVVTGALSGDKHAGFSYVFDISRLNLGNVTSWLTLWSGLSTFLSHTPQIHGDIYRASLRVHSTPSLGTSYKLSGKLKDVGWAAKGGVPGIENLSGSLVADENGGQIDIQNVPLIVHLPAYFGRAMNFTSMSGSLQWKRQGSGWQATLSQFHWKLLGLEGQGSLSLGLPGKSDHERQLMLGVNLHLASEDIVSLKPLLPLNWGTRLRHWLRRAITQARLVSGFAHYYGSLAHFPKGESSTGRFLMSLHLTDATVNYAPGWPAAKHLAADLEFHGNGMQIAAGGATVAGVTLDRLQAAISDYAQPEMSVSLNGYGNAAQFFRLLRDSPLHNRLSGLLDHTVVDGPVATNLNLGIPLRRDGRLQVSGAMQLQGVKVQEQSLGSSFTAVTGEINFDDRSLASSDLRGMIGRTAISGGISPTARSPAGILHLKVRVKAGERHGIAADVLPNWLYTRLRGTSVWYLTLPLSGEHAGIVSLQSDLHDTSVALPPPFGKSADSRRQVLVRIRVLDDGQRQITVDGGARFGSALRLAVPVRPAESGNGEQVRGVALRLGPGVIPDAPKNGIDILGTVSSVNLFGVLDLIHSMHAKYQSSAAVVPEGDVRFPFLRVRVNVDKLAVGPFDLKPVQIRMERISTGLQAKLSGEGANGTVILGQGYRSLYARMSRLDLRSMRNKEATGPDVKKRDSTRPALVRVTARPTDPEKLPTFDLDCDALSVGDYPLGHVKMITKRVQGGQQLQIMEIVGNGEVRLHASGDWVRRADGSSADLGFRLQVNHLGKALNVFGYEHNVSARTARFSGSLMWPAADAGLRLTEAEGNVKLSLDDGVLQAVHPGAGRVLGLFNIYALPRRLLLDFKDVADRGLAFDRVAGSFQLGGGQAKTRNLTVKGPSLRMAVRGRIGLASRDFDETVTVYPNISTGFTIGATLLGGPIAGGIALLAQRLVGQELNNLASFSYRVTGSWDNPHITRMGVTVKEPVNPAPAN